MLLKDLSMLFLAISNIPLVTQSNDTFLSQSGNTFVLWFKVTQT
jgi:hypothetical protein